MNNFLFVNQLKGGMSGAESGLNQKPVFDAVQQEDDILLLDDSRPPIEPSNNPVVLDTDTNNSFSLLLMIFFVTIVIILIVVIIGISMKSSTENYDQPSTKYVLIPETTQRTSMISQ